MHLGETLAQLQFPLFQDVAQLCQGVLVLDVLYQGGDKAKDRLFVERGAVFELQDGVFIGSQCRGEGTCVVLGALDEASHLDGPLFQHVVEQDVDGGWLPGPVGGEVDNLRA